MQSKKMTIAGVATVALVLGAVPTTAHATVTEVDPGGFTPSSIAVDANTHRAFALDARDGSITVIDTTTNTVAGRLPGTVGGWSYAEAFLAVDPVLGQVYTVGPSIPVAGGKKYQIAVQSEDGSSPGSGLDLGRNVRPASVTVDPFTHSVFVTTSEPSGPLEINRLMRFTGGSRPQDVGALTQLARLPNNQAVDSIAVDPLLRQVYVSNPGAGTVSVIDEVTGAYKGLDIAVGRQPRGLAVDTYTHEVFVADAGSGTVGVIDGYSRTATAPMISVGGVPDEVDIDQIRGRVYVKQDGAGGSDSVSVFDSATHTAAGSPFVVGPTREVAIDGLNHSVYAAKATGSSIAVVTE